MTVIDTLLEVFVRLRYPVSLPADIAQALGIEIKNTIKFKDLMNQITQKDFTPNRLVKFMSKDVAELAFQKAARKEYFCNSTLFSFYFIEGWLEFELHYDESARLRRLYIHHKMISTLESQEIAMRVMEIA